MGNTCQHGALIPMMSMDLLVVVTGFVCLLKLLAHFWERCPG